jgi:hypothetical protein
MVNFKVRGPNCCLIERYMTITKAGQNSEEMIIITKTFWCFMSLEDESLAPSKNPHLILFSEEAS